MSESARPLDIGNRKEYWRPPNSKAARVIGPLTSAPVRCPSCGAEYLSTARFCYLCGIPRDGQDQPQAQDSALQVLDVDFLGRRLGLSAASLVFFIAGLGCVAGALLTGYLYRASTVLDWQAVQTWRIEWLLAASVAMLAALVLKH